MDLGLILGLILVLGAYMGLLVYYDSILRLKFPPLMVGLKGRVYPLEELITGKVKEHVDPLELESIYSHRDRALGFTSSFITIVSALGATAIVLFIVVGETILITIPLTIILYLHLYLYKWARRIEVDYWLRRGGESYIVGISVKAPPGTRIWIVNQPPLGEIYGSTKTAGEGYVKLEYHWRPRLSGEYHWRPQLVIVEEANNLLRLDLSKNIVFNLIVGGKVMVVEEKSKGVIRRTGENILFGTIREPEVVGVREYVIGDRLKDIIVKSILKPGGPRVRKYRELLEELASDGRPCKTRIGFILGRLALLSKNYRERVLAIISEIVGETDTKIIILWDKDGILYSTDLESIVKGIEENRSTVTNSRILSEIDVLFIDPSVTIDILPRETRIILPYDWRIDVFECYRKAWEKYLGEIENVFGYIEKV